MQRCFVAPFRFAVTAIALRASDALATKVKCSLHPDQPEFEPNIYLCSTGYSCCTVYGYHSCCASDISLEADANNIVLYTVIAISALFVALAVQCYFEDFDPSDSDIADNTGDLDKIYDEKETSKLVEDPIFGIVPYETPPPYAAVEKGIVRVPLRG